MVRVLAITPRGYAPRGYTPGSSNVKPSSGPVAMSADRPSGVIVGNKGVRGESETEISHFWIKFRLTLG